MGRYAHMIVVLSAIALVSGLALGGLNELTYERAQNNILRFKKIPAVVSIHEGLFGALDGAGRAALEERLLAGRKRIEVDGEEVDLFPIGRDGKPHAVAIERFGAGFGGDVGVMVGFNLETGALSGIGITTMAETPGVGTRIAEESFTLQFRDMEEDTDFRVKKDGGDIDALSGATISCRAAAQGVNRASELYRKHREAVAGAFKE